MAANSEPQPGGPGFGIRPQTAELWAGRDQSERRAAATRGWSRHAGIVAM
jgi:hypothetical protein